MAMSFGRVLARNILTLTKSNPLPLCRIHAINRFIDNPLRAAAIGIRFGSTKASPEAKTTKASPKAKTTKAVKKPITKKTVGKATSKTTTAKKPVVKKTVKKPAPKEKSVKSLTPEQLKRVKKRTLKERILDAPKVPSSNGYSTFVSLEGATVGTEAAEKWKTLTPEQQQEFHQKARLLRDVGLQEYGKWVRGLDPKEVYSANKARKHLKRLGVKKITQISDPRIPKRPTPITAAFLRDQWKAGAFLNPDGTKMGCVAAMRASRDAFAKLTAAEKKAYEDQHAIERDAYKKAVSEVLGDVSKL
ncbi:hypothetical protein L873DRAFT_1812970 [Choiromyces venosus 120613-1]|uniref:HMG box domain-containing protein n=1 Tax=Choiromyces venosus 120613-1 TaxID=1336337 RepID=A0A3N4JAP8_9PEZI|nr:hypothetical protein L873DRAFT_1812970 [Choiromyces venosus 120613-1]